MFERYSHQLDKSMLANTELQSNKCMLNDLNLNRQPKISTFYAALNLVSLQNIDDRILPTYRSSLFTTVEGTVGRLKCYFHYDQKPVRNIPANKGSHVHQKHLFTHTMGFKRLRF